MKKYFIFSVLCVCLLAAKADSNAGRIICDATMRRVDIGGEMLYYQNYTGIIKYFQKHLPENAALAASLSGKNSPAFYQELTAIILQAANISALQAVAVSTKTVQGDLFVTRSSAYFGNKMQQPGLHKVFNQTNRPLNWQKLPAGTRLAMSFDFDPEAVYSAFVKGCAASSLPEIRDIPLQAENLLPGVSLATLIQSLRGRFSLLVCESLVRPGIWALQLKIPDREKVISQLVAPFVQMNQDQTKGTLALPLLPPGNRVELSFDDESITLQLNAAIIAGEPPLGAQPKISMMMPHLPANGSAFLVWQMTAESAALLNQLANSYGAAFFAPSTLIQISETHPDGISSIAVSDFAPYKVFSELPKRAIARYLTTALQRPQAQFSREMRRKNLLQISAALKMYSQANNNLFPAPGPAGLEQLVKQNYVPAKIFFAAQAQKDASFAEHCAYIYIGGKDIKEPSSYPLLFEKPGISGSDVFVVFADGSVRSAKVSNYSDPSQLIGVLSKKFQYTPELLNELLKAVSAAK